MAGCWPRGATWRAWWSVSATTPGRASAAATVNPRRARITRWDFDALPEQWRFRQAGVDIVAYPALQDAGETAAIVLCDYPGEAYLSHRLGVLRLLRLHSAQQVKYLRKQLLRGNEFNLVLAAAGLERGALLEDLVDAAFLQAMAVDEGAVRTREAFTQMLERGRGRVVACANELESVLLNSLDVLARLRRCLAGLDQGAFADTREDIASQLQRLLAAGFQRDTPQPWLQQYPRYMKALLHRVERLSGQYPKDQRNTAMLAELGAPCGTSCGSGPACCWSARRPCSTAGCWRNCGCPCSPRTWVPARRCRPSACRSSGRRWPRGCRPTPIEAR